MARTLGCCALYRVVIQDRFTVVCFFTRFSTIEFMVEDAAREGPYGLPEVIAQEQSYAAALHRAGLR